MDKFYNLNSEEVVGKLRTDSKLGLNLNEVANRQKQYGPNLLKVTKNKSIISLIIEQFANFLVIILIIASLISFLLGEKLDALMIAVIVFINAIVGFIQEYRVEKAIEQLKKLMTSNCVVVRNGQLYQIPSTQLVPGDLIQIEEGQKIPADIRVLSQINLKTIESSLTGESTPVSKIESSLKGDLAVADQKNILFSGTSVSSGKGTGIVVGIGMNTEIGKIAHLVSNEKDTQTPLQIKLDKLGALIGKVVLIIALIVAIEEFVFDSQNVIEALISGVALAVAAIPEGLPAVVTISLALGTKRLLKQKALLRNLPAAETLGSTDIICSDKTGTLTEGIMTVRKIYINNSTQDIEKLDQNLGQKLLSYGVLSSNARFSNNKIIGDTTEAALLQAAKDYGINLDDLNSKFSRTDEIPFTSDRKMMTVVYKKDNQNLVVSKGATEKIINLCTKIEINGKIENLTNLQKQNILKVTDQLAQNALRVLAFAYKNDPSNPEQELIFLGLQAMMDPPRNGIKEVINTCQNKAGIRVVMITGDHLLTAQAIAKEIGITGQSITGEELEKLSDLEFSGLVEHINIYARVNPEHKIRIVKALKAKGHQVAMTGDGVNDAPALKAADIGVAMGITGTDVAKESSDMILLDDHFSTIVSAIREGRGIYDNIRKFVTYLLSANAMEVIVIFIAVIARFPIPLLPIHLLWINLVTDGLPAIALGVDPTRKNIMESKPSVFKENIMNKKFLTILFSHSVLISIVVLTIFYFFKDNPIHAQSLSFTAVVFFEMLIIIAIRKHYFLSIFSNFYLVLAMLSSISLQLAVLYLPFKFFGVTLQDLFKVQPLGIIDWLYLILGGFIIYIFMEILSFMINKNFNKENVLTVV